MSEEKDILILAIESSCDETAAAVVKNGREVLSNVISSQHMRLPSLRQHRQEAPQPIRDRRLLRLHLYLPVLLQLLLMLLLLPD